jgi:uncharacterized heparinase superfamily protein
LTGADVARKLRRAAHMPPRALARRLGDEARTRWDRVAEPRFARRFDTPALLARLEARTIDELWDRLVARPHAADTSHRATAPNADAVHARAAAALRREVDLLGSGPTTLATPIDWHTDFKSGFRWPLRPAREIAYADLGRPNDVKVPWELSRLQWLVPVGQAHLLDADPSGAAFVRDVIEEWLDGNPYLLGVNWACTMDVALRLVTLTWLFHVFAASEPWTDGAFRERLLVSMHLHGRFVARNLERSDVNGNHLTADLAGLAFAGEFFGEEAWAESGWRQLQAELPRQVTADGVDHEMSTAYHRLVAELFLLPALYRLRAGKAVDDGYRARLLAMADFAEAYSRPRGAPLWGDADDARVLPFGDQPVFDHSYLAGLIRGALGERGASSDEAFWLLGMGASEQSAAARSQSFANGGVYVLRGERDHVFVDCGPVGLAGRGGHGHNDCLTLDAVLDGVQLFTDCGSYLYTSSVEWRNRFRSTAFHNTPRVDDEEQNRFVSPEQLWTLHYDAVPTALEWTVEDGTIRFRGAHSGYERLADPVRVERSVTLDVHAHRLVVHDTFDGRADHAVAVPYHLAPGVQLDGDELVADKLRFAFHVEGGWQVTQRESWVSPSYGRKVATTCVELTRRGPLAPLTVVVQPVGA